MYRHYGGKEKIIAALLQFLRGRMAEFLPSIAAAADVSPVERLRRLFGNQIGFLAKNPQFLAAVFSGGLLKYSPAIREEILKLMAVMRGALMRIVEDGQRNGTFSDGIPAEGVANILMGSMRFLMLRCRFFNKKNLANHIFHNQNSTKNER